MIQVDQTKSCRAYVTVTDAERKVKSVHETIYGLSPSETLEVIRDALIRETQRRATQLAGLPSQS